MLQRFLFAMIRLIMKVRCPHCKQVFNVENGRGAKQCPECAKTVLLPRFFGDKGPARINSSVLYRETVLRRKESGVNLPAPGFAFLKRPMHVVIVLVLLLTAGGLLLRQARSPAELEDAARVRLARENLARLSVAVERFRKDCGRYPTTEEGIAALMLNPGIENWQGPYVIRLRPDPWRRPFQYRLENGIPRITSMGADGIAHTEDDLEAPVPSAPANR